MAGRRTNLALFALLAAALGTGLSAFAVGTPAVRWVAVAHGVAGLAVVVLVPWKSRVIRRGMARRGLRSWASVVFGALVSVSILFGILHGTGAVRSLGVVTAMQVHVGAALVAVPFALWHVVARKIRPRRTDLSRRVLLQAGAVVGGATVLYEVLEALPGGDRRLTGSFERGSHRPGSMPVTQWLDDPVPDVDPVAWRLTAQGTGGRREWTYEELLVFDDRMRATIDCTGGWYAEQEWSGVRLARLVPDVRRARSIEVGSVTGYARRFPAADAGGLLLATRAGGAPLSSGHGFPVRLVAPGRRGFWWVKWVRTVTASDTPWWWQPPFPVS